jgi:hypothetical protein
MIPHLQVVRLKYGYERMRVYLGSSIILNYDDVHTLLTGVMKCICCLISL